MDQDYFVGRAHESLRMARIATDAAASLVHLQLAGRYEMAAASCCDESARDLPAPSAEMPSSFYLNVGGD